jgi:hypothetical protein
VYIADLAKYNIGEAVAKKQADAGTHRAVAQVKKLERRSVIHKMVVSTTKKNLYQHYSNTINASSM